MGLTGWEGISRQTASGKGNGLRTSWPHKGDVPRLSVSGSRIELVTGDQLRDGRGPRCAPVSGALAPAAGSKGMHLLVKTHIEEVRAKQEKGPLTRPYPSLRTRPPSPVSFVSLGS